MNLLFFQISAHIIEVGGSSKDAAQLANQSNTHLAVDEIEIGHGRMIPLWMFGLLH